MNIEKEIEKILNNLDGLNIPNNLKAEAIWLTIEPLLNKTVPLPRPKFLHLRGKDDNSN